MSTVQPVLPGQRLLRRAQAAAMLGVCKKTLARWEARGVGPPGSFKVSPAKNGTRLYPVAALERWMIERAGSKSSERTDAPT